MRLSFKAGLIAIVILPAVSIAHPCKTDVSYLDSPIYAGVTVDKKTGEQTFTFSTMVRWTSGKHLVSKISRIQLDPSCEKEIHDQFMKKYSEEQYMKLVDKSMPIPELKGSYNAVVPMESLSEDCKTFKIVDHNSSCEGCKVIEKSDGEKLIHCGPSGSSMNTNHAEPSRQSSGSKTNKTGISTDSSKPRNAPQPKEKPTIQGK